MHYPEEEAVSALLVKGKEVLVGGCAAAVEPCGPGWWLLSCARGCACAAAAGRHDGVAVVSWIEL